MLRVNTQGITKTNLTNCQKKASPEKIENALNYIYHYTNCLDVDEMKALINYLRTGNGKDDLPPRISQQVPHLESLLHDGESYFMLGSSTAKEELANRLEKNINLLNQFDRSRCQYRMISYEFDTSLRFKNKQINFTLFYHLKLYYKNSNELHPSLKILFEENEEKVKEMYSEGKKIFEDHDNKDNGIFTSRTNNDSIRWTIEDPQCQAISDNIFEL